MATVTRFAPSPTGFLHIGGARTALYCWLHARATDGRFLLRVEDTDRERSTQAAVDGIVSAMTWLGLTSDADITYQSARGDRYREAIGTLLESGHAYYCYSSAADVEAMREAARARGDKPRYDGTWRPAPGKTLPTPPDGVSPVVRFANPLVGQTVFEDRIKGPIAFDNAELDDLIIARSDASPTYNLCVVVDDMDMGITDVIRGDDHVNNTPRQIHIFRALAGADTPLPRYAHVPMILGADGKRLSKRHGAVDVMAFRADGFLPAALLNYLARLGWAHGDQELFTRAELVAAFDIDRVQGSAATFDPDKLLWVNQEHIKAAEPAALVDELAWHLARLGVTGIQSDRLIDIAAVQQARCKTMLEMAKQSLYLFQPVAGYAPKAVKKHIKQSSPALLAAVTLALSKLDTWESTAIEAAVKDVAAHAEVGMGKIAQPIRIAVTGTPVSPSIDDTLVLLGREQTLERLETAASHFAERTTAES